MNDAIKVNVRASALASALKLGEDKDASSTADSVLEDAEKFYAFLTQDVKESSLPVTGEGKPGLKVSKDTVE